MATPLLDRIYECSFAPDLWPNVLDELSRVADAQGGVLFTARDRVTRWTASESLGVEVDAYVRGDWMSSCMHARRLFSARHPGFLTEQDVYSEEELAGDPNYRDFLLPLGLGHTAATAISLPTGDTGIICLERAYRRGPVEAGVIHRLDEFRPHLARAAFIAARLQLERARHATETFALIGLPALVIDDTGRVVSANDPAGRLGAILHWRAFDRIAFVDPAADAIWRQTLGVLKDSDLSAARTFAIRGGEDQNPIVANLVPIRGAARDMFVHCAALLVLAPVGVPQAPAVELVQTLFDLTPAEARVARSLAGGKTLDEIAEVSAVSRNTVRTQLRGVMEKTGCSRQAEVVALLSRVAPIGAQRRETH